LLEQIAIYSNGDARQAYNTLEAAAAASGGAALTEAAVQDAMQRKVLLYDKGGEEHFNLISALHKSVRSSDTDAALYWLTRMLEAGEDRLYIARRLIRMASEDIGLADPRALEQAVAAMQAVHFLGIPEGDLALAQAAIYLCAAPKSDAAYRAMGAVARTWRSTIAEPVPMNLRNAVTRHMKEWGYSEGYQHAHKFEDAVVDMECLPPSLAGRQYYFPDGPRNGEADRGAAGGVAAAEGEEAGRIAAMWRRLLQSCSADKTGKALFLLIIGATGRDESLTRSRQECLRHGLFLGFNFRLSTASLRESKTLRVLVLLLAP
jgi:replication-associated recombination protein RarA